MTDDINIILDASVWLPDAYLADVNAALARVEARLAAPCHCDKCLDCLAADGYEAAIERAEQAERERDKIKREHAHLLSEFNYESWRGDHIVYEREWRAFTDWQRNGKQELEQARAEANRLREALRTIDAVVEAWANDETPEVDHPFDADMDFLNYVGHVARAALAGQQTKEQT